jgi:hypothetical protein
MTETWINYSTEESKYGGQIIFFKSAEQIRGYPRMLKTVVTDADGRTVKVIYKTYVPEMRSYQTIPCMNRSEKNMTKNNPEALQKIAETLLIDLEKTADCSEWECSECPFMLKELEDDPRYGRHNCGWLLLKSATSKILRK